MSVGAAAGVNSGEKRLQLYGLTAVLPAGPHTIFIRTTFGATDGRNRASRRARGTLRLMAQAPPKPRNLGRLTEIAQVAVRHGFGYFFERPADRPLPGRRNGTELGRGRAVQRGQHLRGLLDELGPTFVKFGQLLSMRPDVLPPDIITELRGLQDDVRPFPYEEVERVVLEDLGLPSSASSSSSTPSRWPPRRSARCTAPCSRTATSSRQGPAPRRAASRSRPTSDSSTRPRRSRRSACGALLRGRARVVDEFARAIRQELDYRPEARNARHSTATSPGHPPCASRASTGSVHAGAGADARVPRGAKLRDVDDAAYSVEERRRLAERSPRPG